MKSQVIYTLKVCLTTLALSTLITMVIGGIYIGLIVMINPTGYSFMFNLRWPHVFIYVAIMAAAILFSHYLQKKYGYKRFLNDRPISHSIVIFLLYLQLSGYLHLFEYDQILVSYGPMFLISFIAGRIFTKKTHLTYSHS